MNAVLPDLFKRQAARAPLAPTITHDGRSYSRADLEERIARAGAAMHAARHQRQTPTLAVRSASPLDVFALMHAGLECGVGVALIDPELGDTETLALFARLGISHEASAGALVATPTSIDLAITQTHEESVIRGGELAFFTSGTAGVPKTIIHSDRSLAAALWLLLAGNDLLSTDGQAESRVEELAAFLATQTADVLDSGPVLLSCLPPWTIAGCTVMNYATLAGARLVVEWPFVADTVLEHIERYGASSIGASPLMAQLLLRRQGAVVRDVSSLVVFGLGGGPVSSKLARDIEAVFDCQVSIGYGSTETGGACTRSKWSDDPATRTETVGLPLPGVSVRLQSSSPSQPAELFVKTPALMEARIDESGQRAAVRRDWFSTGDLAELTGGGAVRIVGRLSDVIIRGGLNVDPCKVEAAVRSSKRVQDCAAVGAPSRIEGEQEICVVIISSDGEEVYPEVRSICRRLLARHECPTKYRVIDELPRTQDGAIKRFELAKRFFPDAVGRMQT